jgi:hypothetical protein
MAYRAGLSPEGEGSEPYHRGFADGYAAANADVVAGLTAALGGPEARDYGHAVELHHRAIRWRQRRAEADSPAGVDYDRPMPRRTPLTAHQPTGVDPRTGEAVAAGEVVDPACEWPEVAVPGGGP